VSTNPAVMRAQGERALAMMAEAFEAAGLSPEERVTRMQKTQDFLNTNLRTSHRLGRTDPDITVPVERPVSMFPSGYVTDAFLLQLDHYLTIGDVEEQRPLMALAIRYFDPERGGEPIPEGGRFPDAVRGAGGAHQAQPPDDPRR
jgi:hypothetical protein